MNLLTRFTLIALVVLAGSACGSGVDNKGGPKPKPKKTTLPSLPSLPNSNAAAANLGTAVYPPGAGETNAAIHTWTAKLAPPTYRVGYALAPSERAAVSQSFQAYARSVGFVDGGDRFRWIPPADCAGDMHCPYQSIASRGSPDLEPLVERFRARQRASNLSSLDVAQLVATFVQNIRYEIPKDSPFGILPPALVIAESRGDCDSKALLGLMLLKSLGIDSVIVSSNAHKHAMLAIAVPVTGTKMVFAGRQYAFTETTAKGSPIGHINPPLLKPNDWRVVPVQYTSIPAAPAPVPAPTPAPTLKRK